MCLIYSINQSTSLLLFNTLLCIVICNTLVYKGAVNDNSCFFIQSKENRMSEETTTATDFLSQIINESLLAPSQPPSTTPIPSPFNAKVTLKDQTIAQLLFCCLIHSRPLLYLTVLLHASLLFLDNHVQQLDFLSIHPLLFYSINCFVCFGPVHFVLVIDLKTVIHPVAIFYHSNQFYTTLAKLCCPRLNPSCHIRF